MDSWHLTRNGQRFGPYTGEQLRQMAATGTLSPNDSIWREGMPNWVPASTLPNLFPSPPAPAPPAPAPPAPAPAPAPAPGFAPAPYVPMPMPGIAPSPSPSPTPPTTEGPPAHWDNVLFHFTRATGWNLRTVTVTEPERAYLITLSVDEENARRFLVWRRSVLGLIVIPTLASMLLATYSALTSKPPLPRSGFGSFVEFIRVLSLLALPVTSALAASTWSRHRTSRTYLAWGFALAFLVPVVIALVPAEWRFTVEAEEGMRAQAQMGLHLVGAALAFVAVIPALLSLIPGVLRASLRVKALLPQSILPGWFLVAAAPLYILIFLLVFVTVNQFMGNPLLIIAILCLTGAPVLYLVKADAFVRPLSTPAEIQRMSRITGAVRYILMAGVILLVIYMFTGKIMGRAIVGVDSETSLVRPWNINLLNFPLEYMSRALFVTALVADLFMAMNLSVWQNTRQFSQSPQAVEYDHIMSEIEEAGSRQ